MSYKWISYFLHLLLLLRTLFLTAPCRLTCVFFNLSLSLASSRVFSPFLRFCFLCRHRGPLSSAPSPVCHTHGPDQRKKSKPRTCGSLLAGTCAEGPRSIVLKMPTTELKTKGIFSLILNNFEYLFVAHLGGLRSTGNHCFIQFEYHPLTLIFRASDNKDK